MIITGIESHDCLKYRHLALRDLPAQGVIAVSGRNESGKSTIGETVCFALFGRTFSLGDRDITKVIRWGATRASAAVEFATERGRFRVTRYLDHEGNRGAQLIDLDHPEHAMARGVEVVDAALADLIGFAYPEFVESFYLAQREMTTPQPHSQAVKAMAGVASFERVSEAIFASIPAEQDAIARAREEREAMVEALRELNIDPAQLAALEAERQPFADAVAEIDARTEGVSKAVADYPQAARGHATARATKGRWSALAWLAALIAIAGWAILGLGRFMPNDPVGPWLGANIPNWDQYLPYLLPVAGVATVLWLIAAVAANGAARRAKGFATAGAALCDEADAALGWLDQAGDGDAGNDADGEEPTGRAAYDRAGARERFAAARAMALAPDRAAVECNALFAALAEDRATFAAEVERCDAAIAEEQARLARARDIEQAAEDNEHLARVRTRELAVDLLSGAARTVSKQFNAHIRDWVGRSLPLFTQGRYEHLQVDERLDVRVFSTEKRDFMNLDEVSSGTQRQIMLAVRLALSQELIDAAIRGPQFAFLDEPFAFFDETRMRSALEALPKLSGELRQVWVIAQTFPDDVGFARHVRCANETTELVDAAPG